ncbi:MAG: hypothetical protein ISQ41_06870 [Flavobacteriaceae bacterium]|nr:hypothetical protein [Flavobacteriaceae bacterium]
MKKGKKLFVFMSILGIILLSSGLCILGESIIQKINNDNWFKVGTIALILINTGICLMINAKNFR